MAQRYRVDRKPVWGTCAGLILLAEAANASMKGGQELIGGLDVSVHRNYFGRQIDSFIADLDLPFLAELDAPAPGASAPAPFSAVFIRAPVVEKLLSSNSVGIGAAEEQVSGPAVSPPVPPRETTGSRVEILGVLNRRRVSSKTRAGGETVEAHEGADGDIVAVRQGNILGTSFHPELTQDYRIHLWWLQQVLASIKVS
jgi:5'-phosphate synthase pdxT subunit